MPVLSARSSGGNPAGNEPACCGATAAREFDATRRFEPSDLPSLIAYCLPRTTLCAINWPKAPTVSALTDFKFTPSNLSNCSDLLLLLESSLE
jgi:hypothetical protein